MNNLVRISTNQSQKLGNLLHTLRPHTEDFLDPLLFPSQEYNNEDIARFFFFVTSIDHRTSPRGKSFEGIVKDGYFQGADLLWHLSLRKFQQNPINFHPEEMVKITSTQIRRWYTVTEPNRVTISNPAERATLLRDCGQQLRNNYSSSVLELLAAAQHRILPDQDIGTLGLLKLLSEFKAYEDPTRKKSFLFLKFILRRNLWSHTDTNNIRIPVDNHLTRIALRTGIVKVSPNFAKILRQRIPLTLRRDVELRNIIAHAYSLVGEYASRSVLELDDFFWHFGRHCCLREVPVCEGGCSSDCYIVEKLLRVSCKGTCPLSLVCLAYRDAKQRALSEPIVKTWYY